MNLVCLESVAIETILGTPADGTVTVAKALNWFKVSVTQYFYNSKFSVDIYPNHNKMQSEAEFKEFKPRPKFETRLKYGWFHLKLYSMFQDQRRRSIETGF